MIQQVVTYSLAAASANNIALSQSPGAAGALILNGSTVAGGVATLDTQRRVLITSAGNDSAKTFTVTGTNLSGAPISESLLGGNAAAVYTTQDFYTVTSVTISAASAGAVTVGTNGVGSSPWKNTSQHVTPMNMSIAVAVTGTVNGTIQETYDDPNNTVFGTWPLTPQVPTPFNDGLLTGFTANGVTQINDPIWGWRVLINSGTGTVKATAWQAGLVQ